MKGKRKGKGFPRINRRNVFIVFLCAALLIVSTPFKASAEGDRSVNATHANVVLFAYFTDEENTDWFNETSTSYPGDSFTGTNAQRYMYYYDGTQNRSFSTYMSKISGGAHRMQNIFPQYDESTEKVAAVQLSITENEAKVGNYDRQIAQELKDKIDLSGYNTEKLDVNKDGFIDNVTLVLQGGEYSSSAAGNETPLLRSHKFNCIAENWGNTKLYANTFNVLSTKTLNDKRAGVIAHEYLHSLGYPDLYRNGGSDYPVGNWDIMSNDNRQMVYPLAYLRMAISGWVQIPEIDTKGAYTDKTENADGTTTYSLKLETISVDDSSAGNLCNAVTITSPENPYEKFVIEVREKPSDSLNGDVLDGGIPKSGVIVYRVDTTVADYSNFKGKTGVYVFGAESEKTRKDAVLDASNPGYGNSDRSSSEGAITFSNGMNTGIVVSNVSDIQDGTATLKVTVPDWTSLDPWEASEGISDAYSVNLVDLGDNRLVAMTQTKDYGDTVTFYEYTENQWNTSKELSTLTDNGIKGVRLVNSNGNIFVSYADVNGTGHVKVLQGKEWTEVTDSYGQGIGAVGSNYLDIGTAGGNLYISYSSQSNTDVKIREITVSGSSVQLGEAVTVASGTNTLSGSRILEQKGILVVSYREDIESTLYIQLKKRTESGFTDVPSLGTASSYDIITYNKELYFASASASSLRVSRYDSENSEWVLCAQGDIDSFSPKLAIAQGNLYVVTGPASWDKSGVYAYEVTDSGLKLEGQAVDPGARGNDYSMVASGDTLFVGYRVVDSKAFIKEKTISNSLLSLSITPPDNVSYVAGEKMSLDGLVVTANYQNGTRELAPGEYEVTGFGVEEGGQRIAKNVGDYYATVTLSSDKNINNTFAYNVSASTWISSVKKGTAESREFVYGDEISVTVQSSTDVMGKQVALYYRKADGSRAKLTEPVTITDSSCEITYDTIAKKLPTGTDLQLEACLVDGDTVIGGGGASITLTKKPLTASITGKTTKTYDGTVNAPAGAALQCEGVLNNDKVSLSGTIQYDSANAGTRKLVVKGLKLQGSDAGFYEVSQPVKSGKIEKAVLAAKTVKLSATSYTYNGKTKKPSVSVIGNNGKKIATSNYSVSYSSGRKKVGKYTVKVTFKGNYSGTVSKTFKINPKGTSVSKVKAGKKRMTVKWKKLSKTYVTGYQIQYSTDKKFKKSVKTSTVTKYKTSSKTIKKLKAKKKYYVRIRTYKKVGSVKYYSGWSKVKSVKVK